MILGSLQYEIPLLSHYAQPLFFFPIEGVQRGSLNLTFSVWFLMHKDQACFKSGFTLRSLPNYINYRDISLSDIIPTYLRLPLGMLLEDNFEILILLLPLPDVGSAWLTAIIYGYSPSLKFILSPNLFFGCIWSLRCSCQSVKPYGQFTNFILNLIYDQQTVVWYGHFYDI